MFWSFSKFPNPVILHMEDIDILNSVWKTKHDTLFFYLPPKQLHHIEMIRPLSTAQENSLKNSYKHTILWPLKCIKLYLTTCKRQFNTINCIVLNVTLNCLICIITNWMASVCAWQNPQIYKKKKKTLRKTSLRRL